MFTLRQTAKSSTLGGEPWPVIPSLSKLFQWGFAPRKGQLMEVIGRPGSQKTGLVFEMVMALKDYGCIYMAGDMSPSSVVKRLGSAVLDKDLSDADDGDPLKSLTDEELAQLDDVSHVHFVYEAPFTWAKIHTNINAYIALHGCYPDHIVLDNMQDWEGCSSSYEAQIAVRTEIKQFVQETGIGVILLHHASDKGARAMQQPFEPPPRNEAKNGLSEKPEVTLSVGFNPNEKEGVCTVNIAVVKQRDGKADPSATECVQVYLRPHVAKFYANRDEAIGAERRARQHACKNAV